ncbi:MAG: LysR family transcriptional regulator [Paracoccaceae bacterium]
MQIELVDTFLDLVETRSFNRTAERLGVTQSTVSGRVAALEAAVGARLFDRSRAGTDLTAEGARFEAHARSLRHTWAEAQRAVAHSGKAAAVLRIGIQHDLAAGQMGDWVQAFRQALPDYAFYIECDYSPQMCIEVERGTLDFAVLYTPYPHPDLHFASTGEIAYVLVSSDGETRASLRPDRYVRGSFAPAFDAAHRAALPEMADAPVGSGANTAIAGLLTTLGGAGFVLEETADALAPQGFRRVADVAPISQPIFACVHMRHRSNPVHRRLTRIVGAQLGAV